jgi:alpha-tubulin suppressor-like RCC1 family protein
MQSIRAPHGEIDSSRHSSLLPPLDTSCYGPSFGDQHGKRFTPENLIVRAPVCFKFQHRLSSFPYLMGKKKKPCYQCTIVKAAAAGWNFSVALKNDGSVWTWGDNTFSQLGVGKKYFVPRQVYSGK